MSIGYINNKQKAVLNPFDGGLELQHDTLAGSTTRNQTLVSFTIQAGFSQVRANLVIPVGKEVDVEVGGELVVI